MFELRNDDIITLIAIPIHSLLINWHAIAIIDQWQSWNCVLSIQAAIIVIYLIHTHVYIHFIFWIYSIIFTITVSLETFVMQMRQGFTFFKVFKLSYAIFDLIAILHIHVYIQVLN